MSRSFIFFLLAVTMVISCKHESSQDDNDDLPKKAPENVNQSATLNTYMLFLQKLDTSHIESVSKAAAKFREVFSKTDSSKADSAYVLFNRWYSQMNEYMNDEHIKQPGSGAGLSNQDQQPDESETQKIASYKKNLEDNGFVLSKADGTTFIKPDPGFVVLKFSPYLSVPYKAYLQQLDMEDDQGFLKDGGLVVTPVQLAERIVWREKFLSANPAFVFKQKLLEGQKEYTSFLLDGVNNSPVHSQNLNPDYLKAYEHIIATYPETKLGMIVKTYYSALKNNETLKVKKLLRRLKRNGIIYDYSS